MIEKVLILHGGELSSDVASQIESKLTSSTEIDVQQISMSKSKEFKAALIEDVNVAKSTTLAIFVVQTIENESPTEDAGACVRFFKRKTHPESLMADKVQFAVLGLGDSNLLLDRQHTGAKDCNQVAQSLDSWLAALGGTRFCARGEADERTGLTEVEPWIETTLLATLKENIQAAS
jgi:sulfite reductase alpha subunit-like flavoprotein